MKKALTFVSLIIVLSMVLAACTTPTAAPTAAPVETEAPAATEALPMDIGKMHCQHTSEIGLTKRPSQDGSAAARPENVENAT